MSDKVLEVTKRKSTGKGFSRAIRRDGKIPAIFYQKDREAAPLIIDENALRKIIASKPALITIKFDDGTDKEAIIREIQRDPVTEKIQHIDFMGITRGVKITATVPIQMTGEAKGQKEGGIVEVLLREVEIECLPKDLPEKIEIDISDLSIGQSLHISDMETENIRFLTRPEAGIVNVILPKVAAVAEEEVEEEEAEEGAEEKAPEEETE